MFKPNNKTQLIRRQNDAVITSLNHTVSVVTVVLLEAIVVDAERDGVVVGVVDEADVFGVSRGAVRTQIERHAAVRLSVVHRPRFSCNH